MISRATILSISLGVIMKINQKAINTLRVLAAEMICSANKGDARICYALSPIMFSIFKDHYYKVEGEDNVNRDRMVIADPKISALYYAARCAFGREIQPSDLKNYTQEPFTYELKFGKLQGVDCTTGISSQGISHAVGLAIGEINLAKKFNAQKFNIISNYTYCFCSSDDLDEGVAWESLSLAGELKLNHLILVVSQEKSQKTYYTNFKKRFKAIGWNVRKIEKFNNYFVSTYNITRAKMSTKPTVIFIKSNVGNLKQKVRVGNQILQKFEVEKLKADLGLNGNFHIANDVKQLCMKTERRLKVDYSKWQRKAVMYKNTHPKLSEELNEYYEKPKVNFGKLIVSEPEKVTNLIELNQQIISKISEHRNCYMGGSSDENLFEQIKIKDAHLFSRFNYRGKNIFFGKREQAMAGVVSGLSLYYLAPTFCFANLSKLYSMIPAIQLAVEMRLPVQFIFNEDIEENICVLNNIKGLNVFEPKTATDLVACHSVAYNLEKPCAIILNDKNISGEITDIKEAIKKLK